MQENPSTFTFGIKKYIRRSFLSVGYIWWTGVDSDHRSQVTTDLQSVPFGRSGTCPYYGAGDWNRTHNLLITNQLLCQLSYTSEKIKKNGALGRNRTTDRGIFSPLLYRLSYRGVFNLLKFIMSFYLYGLMRKCIKP